MKLSRKILLWLGVAGFSWLIGYFWTINLSLELSWVRAIYQRKFVVAQKFSDRQRILVAGGSGVHMGVDTQRMSEELDMPVINLGLHAGLGIEAIIASTKQNMQAGDIVVLIPEYEIIADEDGIGRLAGRFGLIMGLIDRMDIEPEKKAHSLIKLGNPSLKSLYGTVLKVYKGDIEERDYYTDRVDNFGNPTELKVKAFPAQTVQNQPSEKSIERLANFQEYVNNQKAHLIIGLPWFLETEEQLSKENVRKFIKEYAKLAPVIHDENFNLKTDVTLFGDTVYHLNEEGRKQRASALVQQLQPLIHQL